MNRLSNRKLLLSSRRGWYKFRENEKTDFKWSVFEGRAKEHAFGSPEIVKMNPFPCEKLTGAEPTGGWHFGRVVSVKGNLGYIEHESTTLPAGENLPFEVSCEFLFG